MSNFRDMAIALALEFDSKIEGFREFPLHYFAMAIDNKYHLQVNMMADQYQFYISFHPYGKVYKTEPTEYQFHFSRIPTPEDFVRAIKAKLMEHKLRRN